MSWSDAEMERFANERQEKHDSNAKILPPVLLKATEDHWQYLLEMKNGQQFIFSDADLINADWIHLNPIDDQWDGVDACYFDAPLKPQAYVVNERGIDVRLDCIAWVADGIS